MMTDGAARYKKGRWAEIKAACLLLLKGYRVKAWRYKTRHGEIDLIARKADTIVFVEVKARDTYVTGVEAVSTASQKRIANAALAFMAKHSRYAGLSWRFDVMVVRPARLPYHVKDAWRPS